MARKSAQLLLLISASMAAASPACLLPNDYDGQSQARPYPPQVDPDTLEPSKPKTTLGNACTNAVSLRATIVDLDSSGLSYRWVANNGIDNTRWLQDANDQSIDPLGEPQLENFSLQHEVAFGRLDNVAFFTGVISLFVTDAPPDAWVIDPNTIVPGEPAELGLIDDPNDVYSVIEVRWTFEYLAELGGSVCNPAD